MFFLLALLFCASTASVSVDCSGGKWQILETLPPDLGLSFFGNNDTFDGWMAMLDEPQHLSLAALWAQLSVPSYSSQEANVWRGPALNKTLISLDLGADANIVTNDCRPPHAFFHSSCTEVEWWGANDVMSVFFFCFFYFIP
jgi:hypothetical protein